jgi:hypothetical protein
MLIGLALDGRRRAAFLRGIRLDPSNILRRCSRRQQACGCTKK